MNWKTITGWAVAANVIVLVLIAKAGDINPPEGPIAPTGQTLSTIHSAASNFGSADPDVFALAFIPGVQGSETRPGLEGGIPLRGLTSSPNLVSGSIDREDIWQYHLWVEHGSHSVDLLRFVDERTPLSSVEIRLFRGKASSNPVPFFSIQISLVSTSAGGGTRITSQWGPGLNSVNGNPFFPSGEAPVDVHVFTLQLGQVTWTSLPDGNSYTMETVPALP